MADRIGRATDRVSAIDRCPRYERLRASDLWYRSHAVRRNHPPQPQWRRCRPNPSHPAWQSPLSRSTKRLWTQMTTMYGRTTTLPSNFLPPQTVVRVPVPWPSVFTLAPGRVVTAAVSSVPCKRHGCCNMHFHMRANTTDHAVFGQVLLKWFATGSTLCTTDFRDATNAVNAGSPQGQKGRVHPGACVCVCLVVAAQFYTAAQQDAGANAGFASSLYALTFPDARSSPWSPTCKTFASPP